MAPTPLHPRRNCCGTPVNSEHKPNCGAFEYMGVAGEDLVAGTPVMYGNDGLIRVLRAQNADPADPLRRECCGTHPNSVHRMDCPDRIGDPSPSVGAPGHGLRAAVRAVYADILRDRERAARSTTPGSAEKAIAFQSAAARIMRALDDNPPPTARYLEPPHDQLRVASEIPVEDLGGLGR